MLAYLTRIKIISSQHWRKFDACVIVVSSERITIIRRSELLKYFKIHNWLHDTY